MSAASGDHSLSEDAKASVAARTLVRLLALESEGLGVVAVYGVAVGILSLAAPLGVQSLVSALAFTGMRQPLVILALLVLAGLGFAGVIRALQWAATERIQERLFVRASLDIALKLSHVRPVAGDGSNIRELVNRFLDVATLQKGVATLLVDGVYIVLQAVVGGLLLAFYHPLLATYAVILFVATLVVIIPVGRHGSATAIVESKTKYDVLAWLEEIAADGSAFRSRHGEDFAMARATELTEHYLDARRKHFRIVFRQGVSFFVVQALATAGLLGIGGFLVLSGSITLGQLIASELIVSAITGTFAKFGKYLESYYDVIAAIDKLAYLTDIPLEPTKRNGRNLGHAQEGALLVAKNLGLSADGHSIFRGVNFAIGERDRLAIFGPNGSGKSALMDVLWGMEAPTSGLLEFSGCPLADIDLRELRNDIALVRGDRAFHGTLFDNVCVGRDGVGFAEIRKALEAVGLWERTTELPRGLSTPAFESGLSQGEIRRLLLARAIVRPPKLLLIDGALDGIDAESRAAIARGVLGPDAPWAVVLTTHDESVAQSMKRTFALEARRSQSDRPNKPSLSEAML